MSEPMSLHNLHFPNESESYRKARLRLLEAEIALTAQAERVAALRRQLPPGPPVGEYYFEEGAADLRDTRTVIKTPLSSLFGDKDTLVLVQFMFNPDNERPCPLCAMWADTYNGAARHIRERAAFALVAKAPLARLRDHAARRGWNDMRLLSSFDNTFNVDYWGETDTGNQLPSVIVFQRRDDGVHMSYSVEAHRVEQEGDARHLDMLSPVWGILDLTPEGRGDWYPAHAYDRRRFGS